MSERAHVDPELYRQLKVGHDLAVKVIKFQAVVVGALIGAVVALTVILLFTR